MALLKTTIKVGRKRAVREKERRSAVSRSLLTMVLRCGSLPSISSVYFRKASSVVIVLPAPELSARRPLWINVCYSQGKVMDVQHYLWFFLSLVCWVILFRFIAVSFQSLSIRGIIDSAKRSEMRVTLSGTESLLNWNLLIWREPGLISLDGRFEQHLIDLR